MVAIASLPTCTIEQLAPHLVLERSRDGQLCIFTVQDNSAETLDLWASHVKAMLEQWPSDQPCFMLHDLHHSGIFAFNQHMQEVFLKLYTCRPELTRYVSVVLPGRFAADIARLSVKVRELTFPYHYPVHWEIFTSRKQALNWLLQQSRE